LLVFEINNKNVDNQQNIDNILEWNQKLNDIVSDSKKFSAIGKADIENREMSMEDISNKYKKY
jgi:hypothetical protein